MVRSRQRTVAQGIGASAPGSADRQTRRRAETGSRGQRIIAGVSILATTLLGLNALVQAINVVLRWL